MDTSLLPPPSLSTAGVVGLAAAAAAGTPCKFAANVAAVGGCCIFLQTRGQRNTVCRVRESAVLGEILLKT